MSNAGGIIEVPPTMFNNTKRERREEAMETEWNQQEAERLAIQIDMSPYPLDKKTAAMLRAAAERERHDTEVVVRLRQRVRELEDEVARQREARRITFESETAWRDAEANERARAEKAEERMRELEDAFDKQTEVMVAAKRRFDAAEKVVEEAREALAGLPLGDMTPREARIAQALREHDEAAQS